MYLAGWGKPAFGWDNRVQNQNPFQAHQPPELRSIGTAIARSPILCTLNVYHNLIGA